MSLRLTGVSKVLTGPSPRVVFRDVALTLQPGEFVAIMGDSGVGKSTLLNLIAGLDRADTGEILLDGCDVNKLDDDAATILRRRQMGFVFQAFYVLPHLTLAQNVALPLLLLGVDRRRAQARATRMLDAVGLDDCAGQYPRTLSGGELQRVAIARALVHEPALLLADEPTGNLDPGTAQSILALLRNRIKAAGTGTRPMGLLVTHSAAAASTADRVLRLTAQGLVPCETTATRTVP